MDDAPAENLPPEFHEGDTATREVAENSPAGTKVGQPVTAYDLNGDALSYIALDGADGAAFALGTDGQLTTVAGVTYDYETKSSYQFMVIVMETDTEEGYLSGAWVNVTLTDVAEGQANGAVDPPTDQQQSEPANQAPSFDANIVTTLAVEENSAAGTNVGSPITATDPDEGDTLTYSLSGTDAASFDIGSSTGQITTKTGVTYDYESKSSYSLTVDVSDGNGGTASTPVTVNLTDVNEDPVFAEGASATREVAENSAAGTNVGAAVTATDPDSGNTLTYSLSGTDASSFSIGSTTGQITTKAGVTYDYESKSSYSLTVGASDGNGGTASIAVTVNLTDVSETPAPPPNQDPSFTDGTSTTREVAENSGGGTNVGSAVTATDPDAGDTLTYSLSGTDATSFEIGNSTGQLTTKAGATYDYEAKSVYSVTVAASDGNGGTASIAVTINLTDVAEATPVTACKTTIGTLSATAEYAGAWNDAECRAHHQDSRARYFHFTLSENATVSFSLSAGSLYVSSKGEPQNGWGTAPKGTYEHRREVRRGNGKLVHDGPHAAMADDDGNTATLSLVAGETYTVEAAGSGGTFTLSIEPQ